MEKSQFYITWILLFVALTLFGMLHYKFDNMQKDYKSHNHDNSYLSKDRACSTISSEKDIKELIEERIIWLRNDLKFNIEPGIMVNTTEVLNALLKRLHFKTEYMSGQNTDSKILFYYHFPESEGGGEKQK